MTPFGPVRTLESPLPLAEATARVTDGLLGRRKLLGPPRVVRGRLHDGQLRLSAGHRRGRNAWRPVLHGRLIEAEDGSRLVYRLGWSPLSEAFTAVWFAALGLFLVVGLIRTVIVAASGGPGSLQGALVFLAAVVGMAAFGAALVTAGTWQGRADAKTVTRWITERLEATEA
ncbi:hypothetical protein [Dactylosporangium sp. CS-033363]|uniref:hypothetical protein n=1 Tax=Dactylosporangium sp. CS-033363 TaxID=3239935 RepID=UPI003D8A21F0